ncbi:hypothetical protein QBC46DRAFT_349205 [Diplogelasinospora grovesii]|uniref:Uncharacterized protein n=1 Tax=Diplogelasinospora grovesii TaxID=303347 RepID=A0AAN6NHF6_9PEZI|nr:hypothetical protein QBC46DRAFT_349205 [Diplogelasinospora grovesii]
MHLRWLLGGLVLVLCHHTSSSLAVRAEGFSGAVDFDNITNNQHLTLTWDPAQPEYYPLTITLQLLDRGADGHSANGYMVNITSSVSGNEYDWSGVPYPLHFSSSGLYQLEIRPSSWTSGGGDDVPVVAKSPFFTIQEPNTTTSLVPTSQPTLINSSTPTTSRNRPLAVGLGVAIGLPSLAALVIVSWCFRRKRKRAAAEERKRRMMMVRSEFIID